MSDLNNSTDMNTAISGTVTGEITIASVIVVFMLFSVSLVLYLRAKGYAGAIGSLSLRSHGNEVASAQNQPTVMRQYRLDPLILKSLPLTIFEAEDFCDEGGLECSVCLSELTDRDETRFLPKCRHGFHVWCIDTWFQSNSTCPICRNPVGSNTRVEKSSVGVQIEPLGVVSESGHLVGLQNSLSNRLSEGSSSSRGSFSEKRGKRMLAIEVPKRMVYEGNLNSPALERFRSLRLSLSRGGGLNSKGIGSSCSSRSGDIEQGVVVGSENTERVFQVSGVCYTIE